MTSDDGGAPREAARQRGFWHSVIGWCLDNRVIVVVLTLLLVGGGLYVSPIRPEGLPLPSSPVPVDAIPDIGENQQIVFTEWPGRSPRDIEDQISYPLTTALLGVPGVRTIRSSSAFGFSTIFVIFEDDIEFYWSRSRVLEKLAALPVGTVPEGVRPTLGPDATALGQIFWYTLEGRDEEGRTVGGWDPDELRSIQDWTVRYALQAVDGVSEVASIGGFVREYQVDVDPDALRAHGVTLTQVANAVKASNLDVGARTLEINSVEYVVRGLGFIKTVEDLESTVVVARAHTPIRVRDVARVALGPALRRGALDDEGAPAVGGVVVARFGENPLAVIDGVKEQIAQLQVGLPRRTLADGSESVVTIVPFYDRTTLIQETLGTLSLALWQQILITIIVVLIMLRNLRSSLLISCMLPLGVLGALVLMKLTGVDANVMALGGIAIAIGTMVDIGIVFVENMNQHLAAMADGDSRAAAIRSAAAEVAPAILTSVLTTVVSFLPVLGLASTERRLFAPLAYTKTFAMTATFVITVVVLPAFAVWVLRRKPRAARADEVFVTGWGLRLTRAARSLLAPQHVRDWALLALGAVLCFVAPWAGALVVLLGAFRLLQPFVSDSVSRVLALLEQALAVGAATVALTQSWQPLGAGRGLLVNGLFVGALLLVVLGGFTLFARSYPRLLVRVLRHKLLFLLLPGAITVFGFTAYAGFDSLFSWLPTGLRNTAALRPLAAAMPGLGREYMPPFDEGSFLFMPSTMPHASIGEALRLLSEVDAAVAQIPEVERAVGKIGRAETALDPAPVSMIETVVTYKPEYRVNARGERVRQWREHIRSPQDIWDEISRVAARPGLTQAPALMPINARIIMLQSGMRAPMGIKVHGPTLEAIEDFGRQLEAVLKHVPGVKPGTVFADRVVGKPYLEIELDRESIGRYGLSVGDVQHVLQVALGGMALTHTVEGRERYPVRVRYMREERDSVEALERIFVPTPSGEQIPLSELARVLYVRGPQVIKSEDTFLTSYVLFDKDGDIAEVEAVENAQRAIAEHVERGLLRVPPNVRYEFAGSYENQLRSEQRLMVLIPLALGLVFILLYLQFHRVLISAIIYSGVLVCVAGGFGLLWLYNQAWFLNFELFGIHVGELFRVGPVNLSVAVWIGIIALVGIATDDGVVMATYLRASFTTDKPTTRAGVRERTLQAAERRIRPCLMTTATTILALLPVVTSQGRGADIMLPMALPSIGGMLVELVTLFIVPLLFCAAEERRLPNAPPAAAES